MRRRVVLFAMVLVVGFVGTGCSSDDGGSVASDTTTESKADANPPQYTVTASEKGEAFAFDVPDGIKGGVVTITLKSAATNQAPHDFQLAAIPEGHTLAEILKQVGSEEVPLEPWLKSGAGVGTVGPGKSNTATFDLKPNTKYAFFCTESGDSGSHASHGMSGEFTTGGDSGAEMPDATATITAKEYTFDFTGLKAGENTIKFTNGGTMLHHVLLFPIAPGKTFDDAKAALMSEGEPEGPPPLLFEKGVASAVVGAGESVVYTASLEAGKYVVICFMPDPGTAGPPHVAKGMLKELTIS